MQHTIHTAGDTDEMPTGGQVGDLLREVGKLNDKMDKLIEWHVDHTERLVAVETQMKDVVGNGQPGRLTKAEEKITVLEGVKNHVFGVSFGVASAVTIAGWTIHEILKVVK